MIMNFSSISERKQSLTGLLLVIAAIASLVVAAANCLPIGGDEPSKQVGQESAQKVINRPDLETNPTSNNSWSANLDSNEAREVGTGLMPALPMSVPIGASMDSAGGKNKHKQQHYLDKSLSNHQYAAMHPNAKIPEQPRIWKGLGLGAGILG